MDLISPRKGKCCDRCSG